MSMYDEHLYVVASVSLVLSEEPGSLSLPLTSLLCDLPLLFAYFQVNNGVCTFWIMLKIPTTWSSLFSFQCSDFVFTAYVTVCFYYHV